MTKLLFFILFYVVIGNVNGEVFGQAASANSHKYPAAIFYDDSFTCTGTIINPSYILTAGHCLYDRNETKFLVIVGYDRITTSSSPRYRVERVHTQISRPFSNNDLVQNDIGLMKLQVALTFGSTVRSIPLATASGPEYRLCCKNLVYRRDETSGQWAMNLRSSRVVVTTREDCEGFYSARLFENSMCMLNVYKTRNPPAGDSGSPTVCNEQVFGILSSGLTGTAVRGPAIILMVAPYLQWIDSIVNPLRNLQ